MSESTTRRTPSGEAPQMYQLKVTLPHLSVWRRLLVRGDASLALLHAAIQVAMGWTNSHLHQFRAGRELFSETRHHFAEFVGDPEILDEHKCALEELAPEVQDRLVYTYDFGDTWEHAITVEQRLYLDDAMAGTALCLGGARACPPEDCGGPSGYAELLKTLKNRKHPEHKSMKEWLGRPFDAESFDPAKTNTCLGLLKWPRVTESQLAKVLMARDL